ncbi:hypothetical protein PVAP13_5NG063881 [Panicum virgatum]|uniref:Uncharacterized protein n=1 Tax=Panicum virgatum TaxID=38727 RepID=A0A8T0RK93_PANVG|nr:hypothetical protein PVAP13_5NG063881 [Panicum virgatum]
MQQRMGMEPPPPTSPKTRPPAPPSRRRARRGRRRTRARGGAGTSHRRPSPDTRTSLSATHLLHAPIPCASSSSARPPSHAPPPLLLIMSAHSPSSSSSTHTAKPISPETRTPMAMDSGHRRRGRRTRAASAGEAHAVPHRRRRGAD